MTLPGLRQVTLPTRRRDAVRQAVTALCSLWAIVETPGTSDDELPECSDDILPASMTRTNK